MDGVVTLVRLYVRVTWMTIVQVQTLKIKPAIELSCVTYHVNDLCMIVFNCPYPFSVLLIVPKKYLTKKCRPTLEVKIRYIMIEIAQI